MFNRVLFRAAGSGCSAIVTLALSIAMIVVGVQHQEACKNGGAQYLIVQGSFCLVFFVLGCIGSCVGHPSFTALLGGVGGLASLIILIWGSVTVFGKFY